MNESLSNVVFVDPPPVQHDNARGRGRVQMFVQALMQRPGEWGLYPAPISRSVASHHRKDHPGVEWTARSRPDGKVDLYGRWIGGQS